MKPVTETVQKWKEIGRSITTPTVQTSRTKIKVDSYYVVIGFEVNNPKAYVKETHVLDLDFGHTFFYLVKNGVIIDYMSFGPAGNGEAKGLKSASMNARLSRLDFPITETVSAFRLPITADQAKKLQSGIGELRMQSLTGELEYTAYLNDTCAETARDTLVDAGIKVPAGSGWISYKKLTIAYAVNPYKWHANLAKEVKGEKKFTPPPGLMMGWMPYAGTADPIFAETK